MTFNLKLFEDDSAGAEFSKCRKYRYSLWRIWNKNKPLVAFICLNPSTADEIKNDPTVRRCMNYAESWDCGGMIMLNAFALRSTDPTNLYLVKDPVGIENDDYIKKWTKKADITIIAWGNHGDYLNRACKILRYVRQPFCLSKTRNGNPNHPLYLRKTLKPVKFFERTGSYENETPIK